MTSAGSSAWLACLCAALLGCGAEAHPPPEVPPPAAPAAEPDEWAGLGWEDRHDVMTFVVLPNMARLFQRFRGTPYPDMTCFSCHGADGEDVAFKMPHGLPAIDRDPRREAASPDASRARMAKFMIDEVTPKMADLLGVAPFDAHTGRGFSCFGCHPARP